MSVTNACFDQSGETLSDLKQRYHALFEPSSVAIVGASTSPLKWGFRILFNTVMGGYKGALYAVNPTHSQIMDVDCYPSISAIPGGVELALIVLPPKLVLDAVRECSALFNSLSIYLRQMRFSKAGVYKKGDAAKSPMSVPRRTRLAPAPLMWRTKPGTSTGKWTKS